MSRIRTSPIISSRAPSDGFAPGSLLRPAQQVAGSGRYRASKRMLALLGAVALGAQQAAAQGLGYTITPAATSVRWTDALGLENSTLLGGQLGFDFERFVSLQGYYFTNNGLRTAVDKLGVSGSLASQLANQKIDVRSYGANLLLNLGTGTIVPFIKGGGGVLEFRPQTATAGTLSAGPTRQAALTVGGGLQLAILGPVRIDLFAEDLMFRVNRFALAAQVAGAPAGSGQIPPDPEQAKTRHNVVWGAGLAIPFGPAREKKAGPSQLYQWGLSGTSFALEPMVGRLFFNDDQSLRDQDIAGVRGGFDVGRLVGLRGFYWRGTNSGFTRTEPMESWGGEAQLRLNSGPGITPFLLLGGARLDFKDAFRATNGASVEDQNSLIAGGGVSFPIGERLAVNLSARDYIYGQSTLDSVASVSDLKSNLRNNWLISAGLRFSLGGRSGNGMAERRVADARAAGMRDGRAMQTDSLRTDSLRTDSISRQQREIARARRDTVVIVTGNDTLRYSAGDTVRVREAMARRANYVMRSGDSVAMRDYTSGQVVAIPVPTEGELYVRYGPPGAPGARGGRMMPRSGEPITVTDPEPSEMELRQTIREMLREEVSAEWAREETRPASRTRTRNQPPTLDDERLAAIERRVTQRVQSMDAGRTPRSDRRLPIHKSDGTVQLAQPAQAAQAAQAARPEPMSDADFNARIDARLAERIDQMVDRRVRDEMARQPRDTVVLRMSAGQPTPVDTVRMAIAETRQEVVRRPMTPTRIVAYSGATFSGGTQGLLGLRVDMGPISRDYASFRFVPELALGFGSGARSTMLAGNVLYQFPSFRISRLPGIAPHVAAGLGLLNFTDPVRSHDGVEAVLNLGYGATVDLWPRSRGAGPSLVVEHQGVDVFDLNRLLVGLTWHF